MGALGRTRRGLAVAVAAMLCSGFAAGCGNTTSKSSSAFPNDQYTGDCVSSWNKRASAGLQSALASSAQGNGTVAVLVAATGHDPGLKSLGDCMVVQMGRDDKANVAFADTGGAWTGQSPGNPTDYESGSALGTVLETAISSPNASVNTSGQLVLNYPYSVPGST